MSPQMACLRGCIITLVAFVRLFSTVRLQMCFKWSARKEAKSHWLGTRAGHAYAKYAKYADYADYAHMRNMRMRMRIENLIHIFHIQREKTSLFKRQ